MPSITGPISNDPFMTILLTFASTVCLKSQHCRPNHSICSMSSVEFHTGLKAEAQVAEHMGNIIWGYGATLFFYSGAEIDTPRNFIVSERPSQTGQDRNRSRTQKSTHGGVG